jgi:hypothetical protein
MHYVSQVIYSVVLHGNINIYGNGLISTTAIRQQNLDMSLQLTTQVARSSELVLFAYIQAGLGIYWAGLPSRAASRSDSEQAGVRYILFIEMHLYLFILFMEENFRLRLITRNKQDFSNENS